MTHPCEAHGSEYCQHRMAFWKLREAGDGIRRATDGVIEPIAVAILKAINATLRRINRWLKT